ncbi:hypothetical protein DYD21_00915 [Rhodohalobacter sp. SW132]|uniref:hypothetical protein n=1 Tax=Rhodohalobacter sp. SW132 TaxID=2293433 RepID=UPI000E276D3C|nr:hypothetical protein [Rhodohalobacter sp. SW132]REL38541.1 hypothetical protein DYD21_00915 [Rhodohalobacter sp. SW132]
MTTKEFHIALLTIFLIVAGVLTHHLLNDGNNASYFQFELPKFGEISSNQTEKAPSGIGTPIFRAPFIGGEKDQKRDTHPLSFDEEQILKTEPDQGKDEEKQNVEREQVENQQVSPPEDESENKVKPTSARLFIPFTRLTESYPWVNKGSALQKLESADKRDEAGFGSRIDVLTGQQELSRSHVRILQISDENTADVRSENRDNYVEIIQSGDSGNVVQLTQSASGNTAQITQQGYGNRLGSNKTQWINPRITTEQIRDSRLDISQAGDFNAADFIQDGSKVQSQQFGVMNTVIAGQIQSTAHISQNGDFNTTTLEQNNGSADINQEGTGNLITLRQL